MDTVAIDGLLDQAVASGALPGVVAMVGDRDGTLYGGVHGRLSVENDEPARANTMFWIASMTKPVVSVAVLQLIERGELELGEPVAEILPEFGELPILDGFDAEVPRLRAAARPVTLQQLLTHTSGCGYWFDNPDVLRYHRVTDVPDPLSGSAEMLRVPRCSRPANAGSTGRASTGSGSSSRRSAERTLTPTCAPTSANRSPCPTQPSIRAMPSAIA